MQTQELVIESTIYKSNLIADLLQNPKISRKVTKELVKKGIDPNQYLVYIMRYTQKAINLAYIITCQNNISKFKELENLCTNAPFIKRLTKDERLDLIIKEMEEVEEMFEKITKDLGIEINKK